MSVANGAAGWYTVAKLKNEKSERRVGTACPTRKAMRRTKTLLSLLLVTAALLSLPLTGFADGDGAADCKQLILDIGGQYFIIMPPPGSYYDSPEIKYIDVGGKHSAYVYRQPAIDRDKLMNFAYEGSKVLAVAERKDFVCIIYHDSDNKARAGWVHVSSLTDSYPGVEKSIGSPSFSGGENIGDLYPAWSKQRYPDTQQVYNVLSEPIENCVQFTLDYQVIDCGETPKKRVLSPREAYVNDGSGWVSVGEFDYDTFDPVRVTVNLKEPTDVKAVAVIAPECSPGWWYAFRQSLLDVMTAK